MHYTGETVGRKGCHRRRDGKERKGEGKCSIGVDCGKGEGRSRRKRNGKKWLRKGRKRHYMGKTEKERMSQEKEREGKEAGKENAVYRGRLW